MRLDIDAEKVERLYWEENKSLREIADIFQCHQKTIWRRMINNGIPRRSKDTRKKGKNGILENPDKLRRIYWKENKSLQEIADICGCAPSIVRNRMLEYNIPRRNREEASKQSIMVEPDLTPSASLSYVLGVCFGDGSVFKTKSNGTVWYVVALGVKDKEFAEEFYNCLEDIGLNPKLIELDYYQVRAYSKKFHEWYLSKSTKDIEKLISEKRSFKISFIRGFYDSDGHQSLDKFALCMNNKNEKIIRLVRRIIDSLGFNTSLNLQKNKCWTLNVLGGAKQKNRFIRLINPSIPRRARIQKLKGEANT